MAIVNNLLLRTGAGNPSPTYSVELARFDGLTRQPPTLARLTPRGRPLEHPGHTPAKPLAGRKTPSLEQCQIPGFPQMQVFHLGATPPVAVFTTGPLIPTPCIITEITFQIQTVGGSARIQLALTSSPVNTDAAFAACPLIFKAAPTIWRPLDPYTTLSVGEVPTADRHPLNLPIPHGPRKRIATRTVCASGASVAVRMTVTITPAP